MRIRLSSKLSTFLACSVVGKEHDERVVQLIRLV